jgi:TRAP-type C4-dicarboxylate transport system permease small subunit
MRRKRWDIVLGLALASSLSAWQTSYSFHSLREDLSDLMGPTAWGIYLIVPVPFLIVGVIALLLYRTLRASIANPRSADETAADPKGPP